MGGLPRYALVTLALPRDTEIDDITDLYKGIIELAKKFEVAIVGGDTDGAPRVDITITVIGSSGDNDRILTRSVARVGDKVAVTGYLGTSAAGLEMLTKHLNFGLEATAIIRQAFLRPYPRVAEGRLLVECGVRAAMDISDGLVSDLSHICRASRVSARIEADRVPIQPAVRANFGNRALELALSGGEDYELLFTASADIIERIAAVFSCPITIVGEITAGDAGTVNVVDNKGNPVSLPKIGWEHFTSK